MLNHSEQQAYNTLLEADAVIRRRLDGIREKIRLCLGLSSAEQRFLKHAPRYLDEHFTHRDHLIQNARQRKAADERSK